MGKLAKTIVQTRNRESKQRARDPGSGTDDQ